MIEYRLIRSNRRTLSISFDREGALVVRAPSQMPQKQIEQFLIQKQSWIQSHQPPKRSQQDPFADGAQAPFWGDLLTVRLAAVRTAYHEGGSLYLPQGGKAAQAALQWRMKQAKEQLGPRVAFWSQQTGLMPVKIGYGNAAARWGSMSSRKHLRLNAALVHLPRELADYVIVHELSHLVHPNHSPAFHAFVRSILPNADALRTAMKPWSYVTTLWKANAK